MKTNNSGVQFTGEEITRSSVVIAVITGVFLLAAIGAFFIEKMLGVILIGAMLVTAGVLTVIFRKNAYPEEKLNFAAIAVFGLFITAVGIIGLLIDKGSENNDTLMLTSLGTLAGFSLVGGALLIFSPIIRRKMKQSRCTRTVSAICVDTILKTTGRSGNYYEHIWEYARGDINVRASDKIWAGSRKPEIGTEEIIQVNPEDANDIFRPGAKRSGLLLFAGILLTAMGVLLTVIFFTMI